MELDNEADTATDTLVKLMQASAVTALFNCLMYQWRTQEFCSGVGGQQIQLRTEDRENGDLGAVAT